MKNPMTNIKNRRAEFDSIAERLIRASDAEVEAMLRMEGIDPHEAAQRSRRILGRVVAAADVLDLGAGERKKPVSPAAEPARPLEFTRG